MNMTSNCTSTVHGLRAVALPIGASLAAMETSTSLLSTAVRNRAGFARSFVAWIPVRGLAA
jgi:hypothetical protein